MFQENDLVQVIHLVHREHLQDSDYFFRPPLLGDIGTVIQVVSGDRQSVCFVACIAGNGQAIWIDHFTEAELSAVSRELLQKFPPTYGSDAGEVARRAFQYPLSDSVPGVAEAMLDGQLGIVAGARQLARIPRHVTRDEFDQDFLIFIVIASETDALPIGAERKHWDPVALAVKDQEIAQADVFYRERAMAGCRVLIARFKKGLRIWRPVAHIIAPCPRLKCNLY